MEALPIEIADEIFNQIFHDNSRGLYGLRRVSRTWKDMIDQCTARLVKVWCNKCSAEIPENILDELIQTKSPLTWKEYCSKNTALAIPHIPRDIYESRNEFPNLVENPRFTEIYSTPVSRRPMNFKYKSISSYAVNDQYFAISISSGVRIYSLNNLTHCIREYPFSCEKMDFYVRDNRVFIVLLKSSSHYVYNSPSTFLGEFLINENLIPVELPEYGTKRCVITKNQCFITFDDTFVDENKLYHQELTPNGVELGTGIRMPSSKHRCMEITNMQICNSHLFVFISSSEGEGRDPLEVYKYRITRQPDGKLFFSDPMSYLEVLSIGKVQIYLGADNIPLRNSDCNLFPRGFQQWIFNFFQQLHVYSVTIYAYHVLIACPKKLIIFRGNFRQLMDCAVNNTDPGSRCTVIDLRSINTRRLNIQLESDFLRVHVVYIKSKPQFLIVTADRAIIIDITS